jgi:hypothetical protein
MANRSDVGVSGAVPRLLGRGWVVALTAAVCLLGGVKVGRASGCHIVSRSAFAPKLSWEQQLAADLGGARVLHAPPVLTHPPCQGEIPRLVDRAGSSIGAAWHQLACAEPPVPTGSFANSSASQPAQPVMMRLDRPPRAFTSSGTFQLAA